MGRMGDYSTQKAAKRDAQTIADTRTFAPDVQITVEPKRRKNSAVSRGRALSQSAAHAHRTGRLYNPRRRNTGRQIMGHTVTGTTGNYKIQPYGKRCKTLADVRSWLKAHIQRERRR